MSGPARVRAFAGEIDVEVHTADGWVPARALAVLRADDGYDILVDRSAPGDPQACLTWVPRDRVRVDNPPGH